MYKSVLEGVVFLHGTMLREFPQQPTIELATATQTQTRIADAQGRISARQRNLAHRFLKRSR